MALLSAKNVDSTVGRVIKRQSRVVFFDSTLAFCFSIAVNLMSRLIILWQDCIIEVYKKHLEFRFCGGYTCQTNLLKP